MSTNIDPTNLPDQAFLEQLANQFFKNDLFNPSQVASHPEQTNNIDQERIPHSVAGSGASPSSIHHGNNINIDDPQTSFPDTNLTGGSSNNQDQDPSIVLKEYLPFEFGVDGSLPKLGIALSSFLYHVPENSQPIAVSNQETYPDFYFIDKHQAIPGFGQTLPNANQGKADALNPAHLSWGFDPYQVKKDFPILAEKVNGKPLVWLDNAATTQKPFQVIDRLDYFYQHENSNIHRAAHELAARATDAYEGARQKVQRFINASSVNEIVFVRGTTEGINLVAKSWGEQHLQSGDEIIVSHLEHHANIVPWQQLAEKKGLQLKVIPVDDDGQIILEEYGKLLSSKTKIVSFTYVSNALGTVTPARVIIEMAHAAGAKVLLDGAQSVSHIKTDVQSLNPDWFVFSGHKVFGPTGIGIVYGKEDLLNQTDPWQGGGNMIKDVTFEKTIYHPAPTRFEAGTGNIADAVGLGAALDYVNKLGIENIYQYEHYLLEYATRLLKTVPGLKLIGTAANKTSVLSFILDGYSNDEVGKALNKEGIAVRTGHHCAQPILRRFGLESTVRPSLAFYNTCADVELLTSVLHGLKK